MTRHFAQNPPLQTKQQSYDVTERLMVSEQHLETSLPQFGWFCETPLFCSGYRSLFQALRYSSRDDAWVKGARARALPLPSFLPFHFRVRAFKFSISRTRLSRDLEQAMATYEYSCRLLKPWINSTRYLYVGSSSLALYRDYSSWRKISLRILSPLISLSGVRTFREKSEQCGAIMRGDCILTGG